MSRKFKRMIAIVLIAVQVLTSHGVSLLAQGFGEQVSESLQSMQDRSNHSGSYVLDGEKTGKVNEETSQNKIDNNENNSSNEENINSEEETSDNAREAVGDEEEASLLDEPEEDETTEEENIKGEDTHEEETTGDGEFIGPVQPESEKVEEEETKEKVEETTPSSNEEKNGEQESNVDEASASEASEEEVDEASASEADEEKGARIARPYDGEVDEASASEAREDDSDEEKIGIATYSEVFTVIASDSEIANKIHAEDIIKVASSSEIASVSELDLLALDELVASKSDATLLGAVPAAGGTIFFGTYPQSSTNSEVVDPIKWRVLEKGDGKAYLIADKILDTGFWVKVLTGNYVSWENSDIRTWLNDNFINKAWNATEQDAIKVTKLTTRTDDTGEECDTNDKVFVLIKDEINTYFSSNTERKAVTTSFANNKNNSWILRDGKSFNMSTLENGMVYYVGDGVQRSGGYKDAYGIRPALNIDLTSGLFTAKESNITWNLGDAAFLDDSTWPEMTTYREGYEITLPTTGNFKTLPNGATKLNNWKITNNGTVTYDTKISSSLTGDITLEPIFEKANVPGVGGTFFFGTYPQSSTNSEVVDPIKWRVLEKDSEKAVLLSDKIIDKRQWHRIKGKTIWANSDIRTWLNDTFINKAWNLSDQNAIKMDTRTTNDSSSTEKIYLLSREDMDSYFTSSSERKSSDTKYALSKDDETPNCWWLRSRFTSTNASFNNYGWSILSEGITSNMNIELDAMTGVRPALNIDLTSALFNAKESNITWNIGDAEWLDDSTWPEMTTYREGYEITLPTTGNFKTLPNGATKLNNWKITNNGTVTYDTKISSSLKGNITLEPIITYNITWDLTDGDTSEAGTWNAGVIASTSYTYGIGLTSLPTGVTGPNGRKFDHWEIGGVAATSISATETGDKTIKAVYTKNTYSITWDLKDGTTSDEGTWSGTAGAATYTYGTGITTLPRNVTAPTGRTFDHWEIGGVATTSITTKDFGDKTIKAVYTKNTYNITWDLTDGTTTDAGTWNTGVIASTSYTYGTGYTLPRGVTGPTGRTFDHWEIGGVTATNISATETGDKTIKAVYTKNAYNITWDLTDGTTTDAGTWNAGVIASTSYTYGTGYTLPTGVTGPTGRTFDHWEIGGAVATSISATETGDKTIKAVYTKNTYSITWDLTDGTTSDAGTWNAGVIASTSYTYGTGLTSLPTGVTAPNGRTFDHWEIGGVTATSISATETGDKTIKAVYTKNTYNITWDLTDGTTSDAGTWNVGVIASTSYTYGTGYTLPRGVTGPTGRTFDHWEIGGVIATNISATETGDKTIKAVYTKNTYSITWDLKDGTTSDEGTWSGTAGAATYTYGTGITTLPRNVTAPTGRTFDHWEIGGVATTSITTKDFGDKTIKAVYTKNTYNITWDLRDGTTTTIGIWDNNNGEAGKTTYTYGTEYVFPTNVTGPTGRLFDYWTINDVKTTKITATDIGDKTIKAVYKNEEYTITWDLKDTDGRDGSWNEGVVASTSYIYGTAYSLPTGVTGPDGREFSHWTIDGSNATNIAAGTAGNKTVKAVYKNATYTITWDLTDANTADTGTWTLGIAGEATYTYGTGLTSFRTNVTAPTGRTFDHWEIGGVVATSISTTDFGDKTIKAVYTKNTYNITWDLTDGTTGDEGTWSAGVIASTSYTYGTAYKLPRGVVGPNGRTFDHWEIGGVTVTKISETDTGDKNIKAVYTNNAYNITWDLKDGTTSDEGTWNGTEGRAVYTNGTAYILPRNVTGPTGRTFDHWEIDGETVTEIKSNATGDKTIKAVYTKNTYNIAWDLKDGTTSDEGTWSGEAGATTYTYGTGITTLPTNVTAPTGRTFDHWEIGGVVATNISATETGDKTIKAVYTKNSYNITWDLTDGTTTDAGTWNVGVIASTSYTYGTGYTLPTGVTAPTGRTFDHWEIGGVIATEISASATGDKAIKAVYTNNAYNITWDLKDGTTSDEGTWSGEAGATTYTYGTGITTLPTNVTAPTGRTFDHWEIGGVVATNIGTTETGDKTIKAVYTKNTYNITWDLTDGTTTDAGTWNAGVIASTSYTYGTGYTLPTGVTGPNGRTFSHWTIGTETVTAIGATEIGDKTIKAVYTNNAYNITWDLKDGTTSDEGTWSGEAGATTYTYGTGITTLPTNITAPDGRTFSHWTIGTETVKEISKTATGDKTIKAVYTKNTYNITWDLRDGNTTTIGNWDNNSGEAGKTTYTYGTEYAFPTNVTGPTGRLFDYWTINDVKTTKITATDFGDKTIKAVYKNEEYTITWDLKDTDGRVGTWNTGVVASTSYIYGIAYSLPTGVTGPDGREFSHWTIDGSNATNIAAGTTGSKTVKAVYKNATYNVTWDLKDTDGRDGTWSLGIAGDATYTYGTGITTLPTNVTGPNGREFDHWEIGGVATTSIAATEFGDKTVKAVYKNITYTITWDLKDGTTSDEGTWDATGEGAATYEYGKDYAFPTNVVAPNGRTFDHWEIGGVTATSIKTTDFGNKTIKAVYTKNTYTITWDLTDGITSDAGTWDEGGVGETSYEYGTEYILPRNVKGPNGKVFVRWAINGTTVTKISNTDYGDKTIKAVYNNDEYNITYDLEDDDSGNVGSWTHNLPGQATYTYGTAYLLPVNVTGPTGRAFDHWKVNGVDTEQISATSTGDVVVKAVYRNEQYNITWDLKDTDGKGGTWGAVSGALTYEYSVEYVLPTDVTGPTGRMLDYWTVNGERATSIVAGSTGDKAIKAIYKYKEYKVQFKANTAKGSDGKDYGNNVDKAEATYDYSGKITMPNASEFDIEGFELIGFAKSSGAIAATWLVNTEYDIKDMSLNETGTNNIYPVYKELEVTIDFDGGSSVDSNGATYDVSYVNKGNKYNYYGNVTFPTNINNTGFKLIGFNNEAGQTTANIDAGVALSVKTLIDEGKIKAAETNVCYAVWKEKEYKVEFVGGSKIANGKTISSEDKIAAETYKYYGSIVMPKESDMKLTGFKLVGFSKDDRQNIYKYQVEETAHVKNLVTYASLKEDDGTDASINTLYGVWEKEKISITLEAVNGTFASGERTKVINVTEAGLALKDYDGYEEPEAMKGYAFDYWADETDKEVAKDTLITGNVKLKAIYKMSDDDASKTKYVIDVVNDNAKGNYDGAATFEITLDDYVIDTLSKSNIVDPTANSDYTFVGWSWVDDDLSKLIKDTDKYTDTKNTTLYAVYKKVGNIYVTLEAGTGMFSDESRTKVLVINSATVLKDIAGYEVPVRDDYDFSKWLNGETEVKDTSTITEDITLKAVYSKDDNKDKYLIKVENDDTKGTYTGVSSFEVELNGNLKDAMAAAGIVNPTAKEHYTFVGFAFEGDESNVIADSTTYTDISKTTLKAVYTSETLITLTIDAGIGLFEDGERTKKLTSVEAKEMKSFEGYEVPSKEGFTFTDWKYTVVSENTEHLIELNMDETSIISSDMTVVAQYKKVDEKIDDVELTKYTVKVENDDAKGIYTGASTFTIKLDSNVSETIAAAGIVNPVALDGYEFKGWSWTGKESDMIDDATLYTSTTNSKLYAVYAATETLITVILDADTGLFANKYREKEIVRANAGALISFYPYEIPTRDGYDFVSWIDTTTNKVVEASTVISSNTTLKATYKKRDSGVIDEEQKTNYVVKVENDNTKGTYTGATSFKVKLGDNVIDTLTAFGVVNPTAGAGWTFEGWSYNTADVKHLIKNTDLYNNVDNVKIVAVYTETGSFKVKLDAVTGKFESNKLRTKVLTSKEAKALNLIADYEEPKREGYKFVRWLDGTVKVTPNTVISNDTTLVAEYISTESVDDVYGINIVDNDATKGIIKVNGVTSTHAKFNIKKGNKVLDALTNAGISVEVKDGYKFEGWSWTGEIYNLVKANETYEDSSKTKLTPIYSAEDEITVTLMANTGVFASNGNTIISIVTKNGVALSAIEGYEKPIKSEGYTFAGWINDETGAAVSEAMTFAKNTVLKATYKNNSSGTVIGGEGTGTEEGGSDAVYTVLVKNEVKKGSMQNAVAATDAKYETATIELKEGDNIIDAINAKGLVVVANTGYVYEGWSFNGDSANLIMGSDKYYNNGNAVINATYYSALDIKVILNANTGLFDGGKKVITLTSTKKDVLNEMTGYEEPSKSDGWTFERWEKADGTIVETTDIMSESGKVVELYAIWKSPSGEETGSDDSTKDGGEEAVYTVELYTDATKGTLGDVTRFEVKNGANVVTAMTDAGIVAPTASANWNFLGWSFTDNISKLIDDTTTYTDTTKTKLYAKYYEKNVFTVVLNANTGLFADNTTQKNLESDTAKELGNFAEYDVPKKSDKYTFNGWVDEAGVIYPETKVIDSTTPVILYATYKDDSDNVIGGKGTGSEEGAPEAKYTVVLQSESAKGKLGAVKSFEIKKGENVLSVMDAAGVSRPFVESPYYFVGWSFDDDFATTITDATTYEDENKRVLYALYTSDTYTVTLKANSGMFANSSREKELIVSKGTLLVSADGYEEPIKAGGFTFNRWKKDGVAIQDLNTFVVDGDIELLAVYHDPEDKDVGNDDDTEAGGEKATYTIEVINDDTYGTYSGERYFEIKKDENVMYVMRKVGITEAVGNADYMFAGWAFNGNELVDSTTVYNNTEWTTLVITYRPNSYKSTVAFDSWAGYFADGTQTKVFTDIAAGRIINTLDGYEEPTREGWKFIHWVDTNGQVVEATSTIRSGVTTLIARYEDAKGNEVGEGTHSHYVCGAVDACVHTDGILRVHSYGSSYKAVSKGEEIINYVNEELAKSEADRKNVYVYLLNDVDITSNIELDKNIKLYICLNGFYLNTKKILAKDSATNAEVIISNCKDTDVFVTELDSADNRPMFGTNGIHIFGGNNTIVIKAKGALVNTKGESSATDKEIALQKVDLVGGEISDNTDFISLEGNSNIKLVDVNIKNVVAKDGAIVKARSNANVLIGNEVTIKNTKSNKAIIDDDGILNVADNAKLTMIDNTINKVANGVNGIILLGNATNYVSGDLEVSNNNLTLGDSYYNIVNGDETPGLLGGMIDKLFGIFAEGASPAGDVGYTAAVGLKNANVNIEVKNSKIVVANNNKADNTDVKAGYMYNILSNNSSTPIFTQVKGTVLNSESNIGVAFNTAEGEGIITNSKEVDSKIFKNTTYGKEEKIVDIKNTSIGIGIERKTYVVEYDEGKPITSEGGNLIQTYNKDGSITSEDTRIRTGAIRAGQDVKLEDNTIYTAKGFDLATYSIVRPSNIEKGMLLPTATLSYIDNVYDDDDDINDGEVIRAVATWREKEIKSEGKDVVISQDAYQQIVDDAATDAESNVASYSEADQVEIETEDKYYTVRYWLDGGNFEGSAIPESGYVEDTKAVRANKYTLVQDVEKVATESGVVKSYDFIGWSIKDGDSTIIEEIGAGVESDVVEVIANYMPSTYKITYHLNDGKIKGSTDDLVDTVVRTEKYILFKNVEKNGFAFAGWTKLNAEISDSNPVITVLEAETLDADIEVFAQYTSTTYTVRYHLDGGIIEGVEVVDDIYEDNTADTTKDYHFIEDVTKPGFEFLGWVTVAGNVTIDTIKAGDTNESLREVIAKYRATTFTVNYDADGGIIEGVESMTATPEVGKTYTLYTNVTKEDHEFLGWYDVTTDQRIVSITNAQIGEVYNVKAKFIKPTYNLTLHFSEEEPMASMDAYTIKNISSKIEYVLPTNYTYSGKEFRDWYYIKDGYKVSVSSIKPGNPDNITDVYIRFDDLIVHTINYYVRNDKNETEIMTPRDSSMVGRDVEVNGVKYKVYTTKVNKREDYVLETNVTKSYDYTEYGYGIVDMDFAGWTLGKRYWDNTAVSPNVVEKVKQGISKEDEQKGAGVSLVYDYYAYFVTRPIETVAIKYVLNGGKLVGKTVGTEAEYIEHVNVNNTYTIDQNVVKDGFRFAGWYGNEGFTDGPKFNYTPSELAGDKDFIPLYAKWDKISYSLKYHVKGGIMSGKILTDNDTIYKTEFTNTDDIVLDTNITKDGWTFAGWYDGEGENASKVEKISKGTNQNVDVYARWIKDTYVVTYVLDGGKIDGAAEDTYKVTYNRNNITTLITNIDKYGHKFLGWYTAATGGDKVETIANSDKEIEDKTVYAHWEDVRYTVKFILDGGTIKGKKLDEEGNYEEVIDGRKEVTLYDGTKVSRGDDSFIEWKDANGKSWTTIPAYNKENLVLTASYKLAMVDLVYHFDGGLLPGLTTEEDTSYTVKYNSTKDYTLISDVEWKTRIAGKQMYKFDGWKTKDGKPITMIPKGSEEIKEVYASWVYAAYQIVYHVNGGQIFGLYVDVLGYSYAGGNMWTEKKLATNITKEGYEFAGWYLNEDFSGEPITSIPVLPTYVKDGFIHVNAKWVQEKYSVTYNVGEGSFKGVDTLGNTIKMSVENKFPYVLLDEENVTYAGHKFDGWYKKDESGEFVGEEVVWVDANNKESLNLYAKYITDDEDDSAYQARKNSRAAKKEEGTNKKNQMIAKAIEEAGLNTKKDMSATSDEFYSLLIKTYVDEDNSSAAKELRETRESTSKSLFGSIVGALFGDDEPEPAGDVVTVNTASLKAYTKISAENFGGTQKDGYVCDSFIATYIYDADGNEVKDDRFVGKVYKAGDTLVDIAEAYPNHTVGGRMVFIDTTLVGTSDPDPTPSDPGTGTDPTPSDPGTGTDPAPSPSPSPSYSPSNSGGSSGSRGGSRGGGGGRRPADSLLLQNTSVNLVVQVAIPANEGEWVYNEFGQRVGYKIKANSQFAKAMMSNEELKNNYLSADGGAYIRLKSGFFNINYANGSYYFAFDAIGNMMKGFVNTASDTKVYILDPAQGKLVFAGNKGANKYYLLENDNKFEGILYTQPIVVKNVSYTFNGEGAVISELTLGDASQGQWERDSSNGKWKYYSLDASGAKRYFTNGIFDIKAQNNKTYKYIFDENGYMRTGFVQHQRKTYYCVESGDLQGTVITGLTNINGTVYLFDNNGVLVTPDAQNANAGVVQLSAMDQLQAFMNAMQQMQQPYVPAMQLLPTPDPVNVGNNIGNMFNTANNIQMLDASKKVVENSATTAVGVCLYLFNKAIGFFEA